MNTVTPFLWFNDNGEEAMQFYLSIFKDSAAVDIQKMPEGTPGPAGKVMTGTFELNGQKFMWLNGGPNYAFTPAISLFVSCKTQEEVDYYWERLTAGGKEVQCGWLTDKFGLSWQIVPESLGILMGDPNPAKAQAVMRAMMGMVKISIQGLQDAYDAA